jgi:hypothetical protein
MERTSTDNERRIVPWEDNWGDINWVIVTADGRVLGYYSDRLGAEAALEVLNEAQ